MDRPRRFPQGAHAIVLLFRCSASRRRRLPYMMPKLAVKPMQNAFILVAFPLVGVSAALDAPTDLSGGKVNIHVLMALAAFASVFMGNALEGGLLLAMFNLAHIAEEYFTSRSMIDVKDLKENHPDFALVLDINDGQLPNTSDLAYKQVPVHDLQMGSYILVGAGEIVKFPKVLPPYYRALDWRDQTVGDKSWRQGSWWCKELGWQDNSERQQKLGKNQLLVGFCN